MKLVVTDGVILNPGDLSWDGLSSLGELTVYDRSPGTAEEQAARIGDAEAVFIDSSTVIDRRLLELCPKLRYVSVLGTGYDNVDLAAASERGITVTNVPAYGTQAVAQYAIALLLEICSCVAYHDRAVRDGRWTTNGDYSYSAYPVIELYGKTIGILGFGRIGQAVGRIAAAMGMHVIAYNRSRSESGARLAEYVTLDELFAQSDVISLHLPATPETVGLINRDSIARMKDGVILINNGRGVLVDEQALADALNSGKVYAAGLDVLNTEPIREDCPLLTAKNCFITPHISWYAREARQRMMDVGESNFRSFLEGRTENVVNMS